MNYSELSTPALTIDLDILDGNLDRMAGLCHRHGLALRPHIKTHKMPEVAQMQLERGAIGLTVAKVGEAEVFAAAGFDNILVAYPIYGAEKLRRLAQLARSSRIMVSLDAELTTEELPRAAASQGANIGVLVEFDAGYHRCGLEPGHACVDLAARVQNLAGLTFRDLMTYFGNVWGRPEERRAEAERVAVLVRRTLNALRDARMLVEIVFRWLDALGRICTLDPRAF